MADTPPDNRVASISLSQDFINEQIEVHSKSNMFKEVKIELDPTTGQIFLRGKVLIPVEEMRTINLDPQLGIFRFQLTIKPEITKEGYLILDFPLSETFFYPASSKNPKQDRVIVPVQMLSMALASTRGYLAALSGDFSSFDRQTIKLTALMKDLNHSITREKNTDALDDLKNQRESLRLKLDAVPVERKQLQSLSKEFEHLLGFTGEKELNINNEISARNNALILKLKLSQLAPFLKDSELGGIRIRHDQKDGAGENYFIIDVNSLITKPLPPISSTAPAIRAGMKIAPSVIMRLNQTLLESTPIIEAENSVGSKAKNINAELKEDGIHISGDYKVFLFISAHFDTVVDFVFTSTDIFEVRLRKLDVAGIDFEFMAKTVLTTMEKKLDHALKGICTFKYMGKASDTSRVLQVQVNHQALMPAFPELHLVGIDVREREFLLKIGKP